VYSTSGLLGGTGTKKKRISSPDPRWSEPHGHAQEAGCNTTRAGIIRTGCWVLWAAIDHICAAQRVNNDRVGCS
jgi:hypothetical protein